MATLRGRGYDPFIAKIRRLHAEDVVRDIDLGIEHLVLTYDTAYSAQMRVDSDYEKLFLNNKIVSDEMRDPFSRDGLVRRVMVMILGLQNPKTLTYKTPINWWEMLKRDHAPGWFTKRFPVREDTEIVEIKDIFPFPKEKFPDSVGDCVRIATIKRINWRPDDLGTDD